MDFVTAKSYVGNASSGNVQLQGGLDMNRMLNRHVILVEDIVDTGTTLSRLVPFLQTTGNPTSIQVCTLLDKRLDDAPEKKMVTAKYCGFSIPNAFVIGYG